MFNIEIENYQKYKEIISNTRSGKSTAAFGMLEGEKQLVISGINKFLYITNDYIKAKSLSRQLLELGSDCIYLPFKDDVLAYRKSFNNESVLSRSVALHRLLSGASIVTTVEAITQLYPHIELFKKLTTSYSAKTNCSIEQLISSLNDCGYVRSDMVTAKGEYSQRGDIIDVFAPQYEVAVRVDIFDTTIERINFIDTTTYKSIDICQKLTIFPIVDTIFDVDKEDIAENLNDIVSTSKLDANAQTRLKVVVDSLLTSAKGDGLNNNYILPLVANSLLCDYISSDYTIIWDEPKLIEDKLTRLYSEHYARCATLLEKGEVMPVHSSQLISANQVMRNFNKSTSLVFQQLSGNINIPIKEVVTLSSTLPINYRYNINQLPIDVGNWSANGYCVILSAGSDDLAKRLRLQLADGGLDVPIAEEFSKGTNCVISTLTLEDGFISHSNKLVVIGVRNLFNRSSNTKQLSKSKTQVFLSPEAGDFVVHNIHGVGVCQGVTTLSSNNGNKDYIIVKYRNEDTLYVPVENCHLLSKYSGEPSPRLNKLGGEEFNKTKIKVKAQIKEMAFNLVKLYASRSSARKFVFEADEYLSQQFASNFPYEETADQLKCIAEINKDLSTDKISDRLLVGDVGFGKTEVAMRATFRVVSNGYQVAFLAPTTILSEQHYETLEERFAPFGIVVKCLNRFRTTKQVKEILKNVAEGKVDIIVGTHRLLSKDVIFNKLGLLVLDEEQRFGVEDKEKIKVMRTNVDAISMSATPIPRSLHMALTGMRDISVITTAPRNRQSVESYVVEDNDALLSDIISRELARDGQVFVVYNRVETIDHFAARIHQLVPQAQIVVAHGQLDGDILEKRIHCFAKGQYNVLVCTTIIENGINIPNANTMIIFDSDKLGLSQLYQLRGRVGRSNRLAYAYFVYSTNKLLSEIAYKRLMSIMQYTELGSGFKIAMKDLELRGAGNVLGREQHGHMIKVGYDMYTKLLTEAIEEINGQVNLHFDTVMDVDVEASVPTEYISSSTNRMDFYTRVASFSTVQEARQVKDELSDIYGTVPQCVTNLLAISQLKLYANALGINLVTVRRNNVFAEFIDKKFISQTVLDAVARYKEFVGIQVVDNRIRLAFNLTNSSNIENLKFVYNFIKFIAKD